MKIHLINPPVDGIEETLVIPMGLAYIASALKNHHEIYIADLRAQPDIDITNTVMDADAVAITATILSAKSIKVLLHKVKEINPKIITVVGGPYPTSAPEKVLGIKEADIVVLGEGENTAIDLFENLEKHGDLTQVKGIGFRKNGDIHYTPRRELIKAIDKISFPAFHDFPMDSYTGFNPAFTSHGLSGSILTSRGCPYKCIYCFQPFGSGRWRWRSPESVVEEWAYQVETLKVKQIAIVDDCFNVNIKRAINIFDEIIKRKLNIPWLAPVGMRADRFTPELLDKMKESGCYRVAIGVENGDQKYLNEVVKKKLDLSAAKKAVAYCRNIGIETSAFYILGLPYETRQSMERTIEFAKELDSDYAQFLIAMPYPATEFYDIVQREGVITREFEEYLGHTDNGANFEMGEINNDLLVKMRKKAYWSYYVRPKMIMRKMLSDPINLLKGGYYLIKRTIT